MPRNSGVRRLAAASLFALLGTVQAAKAEDAYGWRGFFVGVLPGYALVDQDVRTSAPLPATRGKVSLDGWELTGLVGWRSMFGNSGIVGGLEADFTIGDHGGATGGYQYFADWGVTGRAVLGLKLRPDLLWFVTAGISGVSAQSKSVAVVGDSHVDPMQIKIFSGPVIGTGFEYDLGRAMHLRGEYLYSTYDEQRTVSPLSDRKVEMDQHQFRLGLVVSLENPYEREDHRTSASMAYWK